jgi:hypothetical protein
MRFHEHLDDWLQVIGYKTDRIDVFSLVSVLCDSVVLLLVKLDQSQYNLQILLKVF